MRTKAFLAAVLVLLASPGLAMAQSTANEVLPGILTTVGCPGGQTPCWRPYSATNPLPTTPGTSTSAIGYVGGFNANLANAPTVQNAAYSTSNAIGGLQTVAAFRNTTQPSGILDYVQVISAGGSTQGITIYGWTKAPSATCTDKVAYAANAADYPNAIPGFPVVLTPAVTQGTTASRASQSITVSVKNTDTAPSVNLYFCAVVNGAVTPASTTDLTFAYSIAQD